MKRLFQRRALFLEPKEPELEVAPIEIPDLIKILKRKKASRIREAKRNIRRKR